MVLLQEDVSLCWTSVSPPERPRSRSRSSGSTWDVRRSESPSHREVLFPVYPEMLTQRCLTCLDVSETVDEDLRSRVSPRCVLS